MINLVVNGVSFPFPQTGDVPYGDQVVAWATAVTNAVFPKSGGLWQLTGELDFGPGFGLKTLYYKSRSSNVASAGQIRLANTDTIKFRNAAHDADLSVGVDSSNNLTFGGTKVTLSGAIVNADIAAGAAIALSKLAGLTASRAVVTDGSGVMSVSSATATQVGYLATAGSNIHGDSDTATLTNKTIQARYNTGSTGIRLSIKDYGAVGDGSTDDTASINAAIAALSSGGELYFPPGTYIISSQLTWNVSNVRLHGAGNSSILKAKDATSFGAILGPTSITNVEVSGLVFDANQANRAAALAAATSQGACLGFTTCTDVVIKDCLFKNAIGWTSGGTTVGIAACSRVKILNCTVFNCGVNGKTTDAFYCSGDQNLIVGCVAYNTNATNEGDTGYVLENCTNSGIVGCSVTGWGAGAAITNTDNTSRYNNFISGLDVYDWQSQVTGALFIGTLSTGTGTLRNTNISGVNIKNGADGTGTAVQVAYNTHGYVDGLTITNMIVDGSPGQALLTGGMKNVSISNCFFRSTGTTVVQIGDGAQHLNFSNNIIDATSGATYAIQVGGSSVNHVRLANNQIDCGSSANYGIYLSSSAADVSVLGNQVINAVVSRQGSDGTAYAATPLLGTQTNDSAPSGYIGEWIRTRQTTNTAIATTNTWQNMVNSGTLGPGDYDITGVVYYRLNGATMTLGTNFLVAALSEYSGSTTTDHQAGDNLIATFLPTANNDAYATIPNWRVTVAAGATTTVYFKTIATFTTASPLFQCRLSIRRVR